MSIKIVDLDIRKIPLEEFMQSMGYKPTNRLGTLIVYKSPYSKNTDPKFVVNQKTNRWTDTTTGEKGGIYDLAYKIIGTANMSELNLFIAGEMSALHKLNKYTKPLQKRLKVEQSDAKRKIKLSL